MAYKTPGVYVQEINTFPPSVVPVETAIPAFVGYTEMALDSDGNSLTNVPTRIRSLLEFERYFGGDFRPATYKVKVDLTDGNAVKSAQPVDSRRMYLYGCVRHFYANGGGPCYIVSAASYTDADLSTKNQLSAGLARIERLDEPTLLLFPDAVSLDAANLSSLRNEALDQCARLQDRFAIMDLRNGDLAISVDTNPIRDFRDSIGTENLKYGAAYYPWVNTIYRPEIHFRHLTLVENTPQAPALNDTALSQLTTDTATNDMLTAMRNADTSVATVIGAVNISGIPAGTLALNRDNFARLPTHFATLLDALRQTPLTAPAQVRQRFGYIMTLARATALALRTIESATLPATLTNAASTLATDESLCKAIIRLIALEKNTTVLNALSPQGTPRTDTDVNTEYAAFDAKKAWISPNASVSAIPKDNTAFTGNVALSAATALQPVFETIAAAVLAVASAAEFLSRQAEKRLFDNHPTYRDAVQQVKSTMALLPVSGAIAGVYAAVDRTRGVWKAPANVSLTDVVGPAVKINDAGQADLNVSTTGKSINAIRSFAGKGTLVWGARTLAGNDNEWRYVPVRRFFNMAEESIKKATEPFVFEPNDANTWVRVRAMIENFLTVQWRQGALTGATPAQAFYVKLGLGETMTAQDILEGYMIIEIGMAVVRPAEFIVLKFAHKMQVS